MLTLEKSNAIIEAILKKGREMNLRPLCVVVTDIGSKIRVAQVQNFVDHKMFMVGGGELIRDDEGNILGAVGVTGATEEQDEELVAFGIRAAGYKTDQDLGHLGAAIRTEWQP